MQIKTLDQLKQMASREHETIDVAILLAGGMAKSVKTVRFYPDSDEWAIYNFIDDSEQTITTDELWTESSLGKALDQGALFLDGVQT